MIKITPCSVNSTLRKQYKIKPENICFERICDILENVEGRGVVGKGTNSKDWDPTGEGMKIWTTGHSSKKEAPAYCQK